VKPAIRLDAVVKLREKDEERVRVELAEAQRAATAAERAATTARLRAREDERGRGMAAEWDLADHAHFRALREAVVAERAHHTACERLTTTRQKYATAYKRAETIRRVADARRADIVAEADSKERKELDEIGMLLHVRR
jgi:flagellar biosynthesis chaperone FliJ